MGSQRDTHDGAPWFQRLFVVVTCVILLLYTFISIPSFLHGSRRSSHLYINSKATLPLSNGIDGTDDVVKILTGTADFLDAVGIQGQTHMFISLSRDIRAQALTLEKSPLIERRANVVKPRATSAFSSLFSGLTGASSSETSSLGSLLSGALDGLGDATLDSLATPALFLGDGVGRGVTSGLKISDDAVTATTTPSGIDEIIDNLGFG